VRISIVLSRAALPALLALGGASAARAQTAGVLHYQGRVLVGPTVFDGAGQFKFALVNGDASQVFWRNWLDVDANGEPDRGVAVAVSRGHYSVDLGDSTVPSMQPIPLSVFADRLPALTADPLYLRVWFNDGTNGFQRLTPDQRVAAVSFAMAAATVPDGAITAGKLAADALQAGAIVGTLSPAQVPALDAGKIAGGTLDPARLPSNVALKNPDLVGAVDGLNASINNLQSQVTTLKGQVALLGGGGGGGAAGPGSVVASPNAADTALTGLGYASFARLPAPGWVNGSAAAPAPSGRSGHAEAWLGDSLFIWGGETVVGSYSAVGGIYRPDTDDWVAVSSSAVPAARVNPSTLWTGSEVIVWGGFNETGFLASGGRYNPLTLAWHAVTTTGAPAARDGHVVAPIGTSMLVWGGRNSSGPRNDGAVYDPAKDQWTPLALASPPAARSGATAVSTGDRILIWGGTGGSGALASGAQLVLQMLPSPTPLSWQAIAVGGAAPAARTDHTAVLADGKMIVWGGRGGAGLLGDGGIYDPVANSWTALPAGPGSPTPRAGHSAIWTGEEMIVLGGETAAGATAAGAAYRPATGTWRPLTTVGGPVPRSLSSLVWAGSELIIFGGRAGTVPVASLQRLVPQPNWYLYRKL